MWNALITTKYGCFCMKYEKAATDQELRMKEAWQFGIGQIAGKTLNAKELMILIN